MSAVTKADAAASLRRSPRSHCAKGPAVAPCRRRRLHGEGSGGIRPDAAAQTDSWRRWHRWCRPGAHVRQRPLAWKRRGAGGPPPSMGVPREVLLDGFGCAAKMQLSVAVAASR